MIIINTIRYLQSWRLDCIALMFVSYFYNITNTIYDLN